MKTFDVLERWLWAHPLLVLLAVLLLLAILDTGRRWWRGPYSDGAYWRRW